MRARATRSSERAARITGHATGTAEGAVRTVGGAG